MGCLVKKKTKNKTNTSDKRGLRIKFWFKWIWLQYKVQFLVVVSTIFQHVTLFYFFVFFLKTAELTANKTTSVGKLTYKPFLFLISKDKNRQSDTNSVKKRHFCFCKATALYLTRPNSSFIFNYFIIQRQTYEDGSEGIQPY